MSAFMLPLSAFQRIADAMPDDYSECRNLPFALSVRHPIGSSMSASVTAVGLAIVRDWYKANRLAILGRYGEKAVANIAPELPSDFRITFKRSDRMTNPQRIALFKTLQCLSYQCSEDVPRAEREWHEKTCEEIARAVGYLGDAIVSSLPAYKAAEWG